MTAGDSVSFAKSSADCSPSDGWTLAYRLFGPVGAAAPALIDVACTVAEDGGGWTVTIPASATTSVVGDGTYRLTGRATKATTSEALTLYNGTLRVLANPLSATPSTLVTHAERSLALIEQAIEGRLPADMEHYQVDGKAVGKIQMRDLMKLRAYYRSQVWKLRNPGQAAPRRLVRFSGA